MHKYLIPLFLFPASVFAQWSGESDKKFNLGVSAGYLARTTVFYETTGDSGPVVQDPGLPYDYRPGVNGTGLNLGLSVMANRLQLELKYTTLIRYDFLRWEDNGSRDNTFYFDHNFSLSKWFRFKTVPKERPKYVGVGYSLINTGGGFHYERYVGPNLPPENTFFSVDFDAFRIFVGIPVWKIYLEPGVYLVNSDFPGPIKDKATMLYLEAVYKSNLFNK